MEEPENGIHPGNLEAVVELLRDLAVDPYEAPGDDNPFRQVIVNTHSPSLVQLLDPAELLFATADASKDDAGKISSVLHLAPLHGTWRDGRQDEPPVTKADILPYLTSPPGSQLALDTVSA
jgi:predicted ATPase